jgi:hypothetical protein
MYIENFKSNADIIKEFEAPADALDGAEVLLAWYGYGSYCGDSFVLFKKDGKLFEANGSHCSCYGLEGQWHPEETSVEALEKRKLDSYCDGGSEADVRLKDIVKQLKSK